MRTFIALMTLIALVAAACGSAPAVSVDGTWQLESGTFGGAPIPLLPTHPVTMTVDGPEISGVAACNEYRGRIDVSGDAFVVEEWTATAMGCLPPEVMDAETAFLSALDDVTTVEVTGDGRLVLRGPDSELVFRSRQG